MFRKMETEDRNNGIYREWKKIHMKCEREKRHRDFLQDCKYFNITPNFMKIRNKYLYKEYRREIENFHRIVLNKMIRGKYGKIAGLERERDERKREAEKTYSEGEMSRNREKIRTIEKREERIHTEKQQRKLRYWIEKRGNKGIKREEQEFFPYINASRMKLNTHQDMLIKKGAKYILEDRINLRDTIPKIENLLEKIPAHMRSRWRGEIQTDIERRMKDTDRDDEDRRELAKLKKNRDIAFLQTDKTGKIVIMDRREYEEKMTETIEKLNIEETMTDPDRKITEKIKKVIKEGEWPEEYKKPENQGIATNTPRIFGKYKDHKTPPTIRPIVNKKESATYAIEKYMKQIYQEIMPQSDNTLKSTNEFINFIRTIKLEKGQKMVSFDVKDLYPSINNKEITEILENLIKEKYGYNRKIAETLLITTNLILNNSYFTFKGRFFRQKEGVPMGSPISGPLAEIKMRILEEEILGKNREKIKYWKRYVDDIFAVIEREEDPENILMELNKTDENIKFTLEEEKEGQLNYLDVKIIRKNDEIETTVYRKPEKTDQIIHARCRTPKEYKQAALRAYIDRAINICSNEDHLEKELTKIREIGRKAGYGEREIEKIIRKRKKGREEITPGQRQKKIFTEAINYDKGLGIKIKNKGKKVGLTIPIKQNKNIFERIRNERDQIAETETSGIYRIPIKEENGEEGFYIGMTKRRISTRVKEHQHDIKIGKTGTALAQKYNKENIEIDFKNVKKLANYNSLGYAIKREATEIAGEKRSINITESAILDKRWRHLMGKNKGKREKKTEERQNNNRPAVKRREEEECAEDDPEEGSKCIR